MRACRRGIKPFPHSRQAVINLLYFCGLRLFCSGKPLLQILYPAFLCRLSRKEGTCFVFVALTFLVCIKVL